TDLLPLVGVSGVRGVGFGMVTVAGTALAARLVPGEQLGRATAFYGLAVGIPQVFILPGGVALAVTIGVGPTFCATRACGVIAAALSSGTWFADGRHSRSALRSTPRASGTSDSGEDPRCAALTAVLTAPLVMTLTVASAASPIVSFVASRFEPAA